MNNITINNLEQWYTDFQTLMPIDNKNMTQAEATFRCLQGISFMFDKIVNVGFKDLLDVGTKQVNDQANESCWCDINELCRRHPELRKSNVKSRQWRLDNDFPCKSEFKCHQMFYEPDVVEWINKHLRGKKC